MKLKFLIVENNKEEQKKIREILQKRGIGFKIFSNFKSAAYDLQEERGMFNNPSEYTGVITDINFPVSENTDKRDPSVFIFIKSEEEAKIPCTICTKNKAHDDDGWTEIMLL